RDRHHRRARDGIAGGCQSEGLQGGGRPTHGRAATRSATRIHRYAATARAHEGEHGVKTIDGPGVFLAHFMTPEPPFNRLETLAAWAAEKGFKAVQIPTFDSSIFDVAKAAESEAYCDDVKGLLASHGLVISELSSHRPGHVLGSHRVYGEILDALLPPAARG